MLTDKQILGPNVTDITFLLDILPTDGAEAALSPEITKVLSYGYIKGLHLVRMPRCILFGKADIPELKPQYDEAYNQIGIEYEDHRPGISRRNTYSCPALLRVPKDPMIQRARSLLGTEGSAEEVWSQILSVASASVMHGGTDGPCLVVTNDRTLLSNQIAIQKMFRRDPIRIVTQSEALRILDLNQKELRCYELRPCCTAGRYGWYQAAAESDLPNVPDESLLARAMHIRYGLDALGGAYYGDKDSADTEESTYHFDYLLLLLTASLDNAALQVAHRYTINQYSISMRPPELGQTTGNHAEFYRKIQCANPAMAELWNRSVTFLHILYDLRDATAHLDILGQFPSDYIPRYSGQRMISVNLSDWNPGHSQTPEEMFNSAEGPSTPFEPCSSLGILPIGAPQKALNLSLLLEPYHFAVEAWARVRYLVNESARLCGFPLLLQEADDPRDPLKGWKRTFREQALNGLPIDVSDSRSPRRETTPQ